MTENKRFTYLVFVVVFLAMFVAVFFSINNTYVHADPTYTITWIVGENSTESQVEENEIPAYEGATTIAAEIAGYHRTIIEWTPAIVAATENATYEAVLSDIQPNTDTPYKVHVFKQQATGNGYDEEYLNKTGTTATEASVADAFEHFTLDTENPNNVLNGTITGNGELVLVAYYNRETFNVTWKDGDNNQLGEIETYRYGATPVYSGTTPTTTAEPPIGKHYVFNNAWEPAITEVTADATYTARFVKSINEYTITYPTDPGFTILVKNAAQESVASGSKVTIEDALTIVCSITPGYAMENDLAVSSDNSDYSYDSTNHVLTNINEDIELSFSVTPNLYTISFKLDNIDSISAEYQVVVFGQIDNLIIPQKNGYNFIGWYFGNYQLTDQNGLMLEAYNMAYDIDVDAHFAEAKYTITYDNYFKDETKEVEFNSTYSLKVPTRVGYVFDGWYYNLDKLTGVDGNSIGAYSYPNDIQIESHWIKITIELNLDRVVIENEISKVTKLNATITPAGSSTVTFETLNENAFTVDQEGNVTCVGNGRAIIRAIIDDGKDYVDCEFISVDKIYTNDECILYVDINEGLDLNQYAVLCAPTDKLSYVAAFVKGLYNIPNTHILRTDIGVELDESLTIAQANLNDGDTLVINLFYSVTKATNSIVNYKIVNPHVEYGKPCYIEDIRAKSGYKHGKLIAKSENSAPVTVYQDGYYLIMVNSNVVTDVLITEIDSVKTNIEDLKFVAKDGWDPAISVSANSIALDAYNRDIKIPEEKKIIYVMYVEFTEGEEKVACNGKEYTIKMKIPQEFKNQEEIRIKYLEDGQTKTRNINIKDGMVELTLTGSGDFVFIANVLESTVYLYWLIVLLLFLDAILGMVVIIMVINYQDALQRRRDINGYSTILPVVLLSAVIAGELAFVVFLGIVFVAEIIAIAWLGLKLTNKYFIYTTYHKLSYNPYREYHNIENKNKENNSNNTKIIYNIINNKKG